VSLLGCNNSPATHSPAVRVSEPAALSVAIGYHGRVIFAKGYGKADLASGAPMTAQTRLGIGSLLKRVDSRFAAGREPRDRVFAT